MAPAQTLNNKNGLHTAEAQINTILMPRAFWQVCWDAQIGAQIQAKKKREANAAECEKQGFHVLKFRYLKMRNLLSVHSGENSIQMVHQEDPELYNF